MNDKIELFDLGDARIETRAVIQGGTVDSPMSRTTP
jgi:hypothetical protein